MKTRVLLLAVIFGAGAASAGPHSFDRKAWREDYATVSICLHWIGARVSLWMPRVTDGSDEVASIKPDLPVLPTANESPQARAARVLAVIDRDLPR